jgi:cobalt-zinc-cadmium efflux system membrane fusion protein
MNPSIPRCAAALLALLLTLALPSASAHEGEEHGAAVPPPAQPASAQPRLETASPDVELVALLQDGKLTIYLDHYADNAPIDGAQVELESGSHKAVAQAAGDGVYSVAADWLTKPGKYEMLFTIQAGDLQDLLTGTLEVPAQKEAAASEQRIAWVRWLGATVALLGLALIASKWRRRAALPSLLAVLAMLPLLQPAPGYAHGGEDHGDGDKAAASPLPAGSAPARLGDGSVFVPKAAQRLLGLRTVLAKEQEITLGAELNGHVLADPNFSGRVQASQSGRIEAGPRGLPHLGEKVAKGQVLAYLVPAAGSLERGNSQAQLAEVEAQLGLAQKRAERLEQLSGSIPRRDLDAAHAELEGLKQRKAALAASLNQREALRAPVSGSVSRAAVVAGQVVEARDVLFEIVNPDKLWVEALAYDTALAGQVAGGTAVTEGGQTVALTLLGRSLELREHAVPLQFRVVSPAPPLSVSEPLKVYAQTRQRVRGILLPRASVGKSAGGESEVWVHVSAERFAPRKVRVQPVDGTNVAVVQGLHADERVVSAGAPLLSQIR